MTTPEAAPVVTDEKLLAMRSWSSYGSTIESDLVEFGRNCYNLGRQHGAAQPPAPHAAPPRQRRSRGRWGSGTLHWMNT